MTRSGKAVLVAIGVLVVVGVGFGIGAATSSPRPRSAPGTVGSSPLPSLGGGPTTAQLPIVPVVPVVACATTYPDPSRPGGPSFPTSEPVKYSSSEAAQLSFYSNDRRTETPVLGPRGWHCQMAFSEDGSVGVSIYPGSSPPQSNSGMPFVAASSDGRCQGCVYAEVCSYLPAAAQQLGYAGSGIPCLAHPVETVEWISGSPNSPTAVGGDTIGWDQLTSPDPTNGVLLYRESAGGGGEASADVCTLSAVQHTLCTAILDDFVLSAWLMH